MDKYSKTRYNRAPTINKGRTRFDLSHSILTTLNTGDFVPMLAEPVYPGDTFDFKSVSFLLRLETSLHQTMDNAYFEYAFFFVPARIVWDDFEKFLGASDDPWVQSTEYTIPQITLTATGGSQACLVGSMYNYLGIPVGNYGYGSSGQYLSFDALPARSIFQIYNDWYRDENYDSIIAFSKASNDVGLGSGFTFNGSRFYPCSDVLKVNRFKDVFSTALPAPQKGGEISFGLSGLLPITVDSSTHALGGSLKFGDYGGSDTASDFYNLYINGGNVNDVLVGSTATTSGTTQTRTVTKSNLVADLGNATAVTINQLRLAIAAQAIKERDARGGTRYKEKIYSTWGVNAQDLEIDRSEFLGGKRLPISMMEVLQTSETGTTVLGSDAGHSKTVDSSDGFIKSFTQYGWIIGVCYVRTARSYSQGIDRKFRNKTYYDLYDPMLDNIGEVAVLKSELYALDTDDATSVADTEGAWAYQEAWYHLKERTNRFSGYFQPGITGTLDSWHYGDNYSALPQMSASWLKEGTSNVDRTIAVSSNASFQFSLNMHFDLKATRTMNKYSIPNTFGF